MEEASLALSIVAITVSLFGVGWTVYEWRRSGARVTVKLTSFVTFGGPLPDEWMVSFGITNTGRAPTSVYAVGFQHHRVKGVMVIPSPATGPNPIPRRLEPGESFNYPIRCDTVWRECKAKDLDWRDLTTYVNTGHGIFKGKLLSQARDVIEADENRDATTRAKLAEEGRGPEAYFDRPNEDGGED